MTLEGSAEAAAALYSARAVFLGVARDREVFGLRARALRRLGRS